MIKSKAATLPSCCFSTHSLIAIVAHTVEVTLIASLPAISSGESATLRLPLSIINGDALSIHAYTEAAEVKANSMMEFLCSPPEK